jgi:hypothetical protein
MKPPPHLWLLTALLLPGCALEEEGISIRATLPRAADAACVDAALRRIEGIGPVRYEHTEHRSYQLLPRRGWTDSRSDIWQYGGEGMVQIHHDEREISYLHSLYDSRDRIPEAQLQAMERRLRQVNDVIERSCGLPLRRLGVVERH